MIGRLAARSLLSHPIRSAVLAGGFGAGVAVMAILLGVAEIVLRQAESPALVGGGDVLIQLSAQVPAQLMLSGTLQSEALQTRIETSSPFATSDLDLIVDGRSTRVRARAGIPSLERAMGDAETEGVSAWTDTETDRAWTLQTPERVLRHIDRFHPIPDAPAWSESWAEWLYFNGRAGEARFYLTFLVGPRAEDGRRTSGVRLQLERPGTGRLEVFSETAALTDEEVDRAPDLTIGASSVRLDGLVYRIHLDLRNNDSRVHGDLALHASPGRLVPPLEVTGSQGWVTGYVVPVMAGRLDGSLNVEGEVVSLDGGTGYHDHNWGFWEGVSWRWGQVQHEDLSLLYGRVFPPVEAADPERLPGFVGLLGPDGPIAYAQNVQITETDDDSGRPQRIELRARGPALDLTVQFDVESIESTRSTTGPWADGVDFLQMRGEYRVRGRAGSRTIDFRAHGSAETFR